MRLWAIYSTTLAQRRQAQINLDRTTVRSSIDGIVTNLTMRPGDYASAGQVNIHIIDTSSFWVDGYFEEVKVHDLSIGDPVRMDLMGYHTPLYGHVDSITRGIASKNALTNTLGLPMVDPVYTWVRLAQRIPVRIALDTIPPDLNLAAGMTATVTVISEKMPSSILVSTSVTFSATNRVGARPPVKAHLSISVRRAERPSPAAFPYGEHHQTAADAAIS